MGCSRCKAFAVGNACSKGLPQLCAFDRAGGHDQSSRTRVCIWAHGHGRRAED